MLFLSELYGRLSLDRMNDRTNFPDFIQADDIFQRDAKIRLYDVCLYFNASARIQRLISQQNYQVEITTYEDFQDYFLGGPFCYAVIETMNHRNIITQTPLPSPTNTSSPAFISRWCPVWPETLDTVPNGYPKDYTWDEGSDFWKYFIRSLNILFSAILLLFCTGMVVKIKGTKIKRIYVPICIRLLRIFLGRGILLIQKLVLIVFLLLIPLLMG